jgi:hypothetical protein
MKINITKYERDVLVPKIICDFRKHYSRFHPITSAEYCKIAKEDGFSMVDVTFRKLVRYIQLNGLLKYIIADNYGFYRTTSKSMLKRQILSLKSREEEIRERREALEKQMNISSYNNKTI